MEEKVQSNDLGDQSGSETPKQEQVETAENIDQKSMSDLKKRLAEVNAESKRRRQSEQDLKRQLEDLKIKELEASGQLKTAVDYYKNLLDEEKNSKKSITQAFAETLIKKTVVAEAVRAGCVDPDVLVNLISISQVPIDDNFNVDDGTVKLMLDDFKKNKPYLFQKAAPKVVDSAPVKTEVNTGPSLSKMSLAEKAALLAQLTKK